MVSFHKETLESNDIPTFGDFLYRLGSSAAPPPTSWGGGQSTESSYTLLQNYYFIDRRSGLSKVK